MNSQNDVFTASMILMTATLSKPQGRSRGGSPGSGHQLPAVAEARAEAVTGLVLSEKQEREAREVPASRQVEDMYSWER